MGVKLDKHRFQDKYCDEPISVIIPDKSFKNKIIVYLVRLQHKAKLETVLAGAEHAVDDFKGPLMVFGSGIPAPWLKAVEEKNNYKFILFDNQRSSREKYSALKSKEIKTDKTIARVLFEYYKLQDDSWLIDYTDDPKLWRWKNISSLNLKAGIEALSFDIEKLWKMDIQEVAAVGSDAILKKAKVEEAKTEKECKDEPEEKHSGPRSKGKDTPQELLRGSGQAASPGGGVPRDHRAAKKREA